MKLNQNINYIVSGLERSGTSMLMQILHAGGAPMAYDHDSRPPDDNNPKGYFELEGGKIITRLMNGNFNLDKYRGEFIKITAYGLKFLPESQYKIIYSERHLDEILDSMEKMARIRDDSREETRDSFLKLNEMIKGLIQKRSDTETLFISYNEILAEPEKNITRIHDFIGSEELDLEKMMACVDKSLYRNRRN